MRAAVQTTVALVTVTFALFLGWAAVMTTAFRAAVARDWETRRCEPGVVLLAGWLKPEKDPRTSAQFAKDNWSFCQKEYVEHALRTAAQVPEAATRVQAGISQVFTQITGTAADMFYHLWRFCYEAYSSFMEKMKSAATLFRNFLSQTYAMVMRMEASVTSIAFGLIALIVGFINSVQLSLIVAIVVVGILLLLQIILFFLLLPISSVLLTMTAVIAGIVVAVTTAVSAAMVAELFTPGACFDAGTQVILADGTTRPIEKITIGTRLAATADGSVTVVTAVHEFDTRDVVWTHDGIRVTGDHLVEDEKGRLERVQTNRRFVAEAQKEQKSRRVWCLTTTSRRIPVRGGSGQTVQFADWEEIDDSDDAAKDSWCKAVWARLNPSRPQIPAPLAESLNMRAVTEADAGISPDTLVQVVVSSWWGSSVRQRRAADIQIGDTVVDADGRPTRVIGRVEMEGSVSVDAVTLGADSLISVGCWIWSQIEGCWMPPVDAAAAVCDAHPARWLHFYTTSGSFRIVSDGSDGYISIRDASDVGLDTIGTLVDEVILRDVSTPSASASSVP
uniref:Uncharacterized protein n=1 Tax=viral metagenome TaxID=1070528 RepID=A0A6C0D974_9ZZZZ